MMELCRRCGLPCDRLLLRDPPIPEHEDCRPAVATAIMAERVRTRLAILAEFPFDAAWCEKHAEDDHLCDLDHKDELEIAEFGLWLYGRGNA